MLPKKEVEAPLATASGPQTLPITFSRLRSILRVRSSLIGVQLSPRSSLRKTRCAAKYRRVGLWGERTSGESQFQRRGSSPGFSWGWMRTASPLLRS